MDRVVEVERDALNEAWNAAAALEVMFQQLSPVEKALAAKQIEAVRRLVVAVNAL